jgi:hypothetical protein
MSTSKTSSQSLKERLSRVPPLTPEEENKITKMLSTGSRIYWQNPADAPQGDDLMKFYKMEFLMTPEERTEIMYPTKAD